MKEKMKYYLKSKPGLCWILYNIYNFPYKIKNFIFGYFFRLMPIQKQKIVICNYFGKGYGDNGKYLAEEIIRQRLGYDIVWLLREEQIGKSKFPSQVRTVKYNSLRALYELATAKIWIDNCRKFFYPPKRKGQYYIQTWHGGVALKQIEKDAENNLSISYVEEAKHDSSMANLFVSNSNFCTNMYQSAFWYNGEILECGSPRCDILINRCNGIDKKVREYFNLEANKRILTYAPTFRVDSNTNIYNIEFEKLISVLENKFGGEWVILVRLHPNISDKDNFMNYSSNVLNATSYDDMYELLGVSDMLITDYSSTMFEFSFTHKPVFLYAPDIENYIKDRNFYFDIYSLPYPVAKGNSELFNTVELFDKNKYLNDLNVFLADIGVLENGQASKKIIENINLIIMND